MVVRRKIDELNNHKLLHYSSQSSGNVWKITAPSGEKAPGTHLGLAVGE